MTCWVVEYSWWPEDENGEPYPAEEPETTVLCVAESSDVAITEILESTARQNVTWEPNKVMDHGNRIIMVGYIDGNRDSERDRLWYSIEEYDIVTKDGPRGLGEYRQAIRHVEAERKAQRGKVASIR